MFNKITKLTITHFIHFVSRSRFSLNFDAVKSIPDSDFNTDIFIIIIFESLL